MLEIIHDKSHKRDFQHNLTARKLTLVLTILSQLKFLNSYLKSINKRFQQKLQSLSARPESSSCSEFFVKTYKNKDLKDAKCVFKNFFVLVETFSGGKKGFKKGYRNQLKMKLLEHNSTKNNNNLFTTKYHKYFCYLVVYKAPVKT